MMEFMKSIMISAAGLRAQNGRMKVVAENLANANSTGQTPGADPYRRKIPTFKLVMDRQLGEPVVQLGAIRPDRTAFTTRYEPGHPAADEKGYVKQPNVNTMIEVMDMRQAQRSYEANLGVIEIAKNMIARTIDILRG